LIRLVSRWLRGLVLGMLSFAAIIAGLIGVWAYTGPPVIPHGNSSRFFEQIEGTYWSMGFLFREFRDSEVRIGAIQQRTFLFIEYKGDAQTKQLQFSRSAGPFLIRYDSMPSPFHCGLGLSDLSDEELAYLSLPSVRLLLQVPPWFPGPILATYPIWAFVRGPMRRHRRKNRNECLKCGYSLTGNVSGLCPECGTKVANECR